MATKIEVKPFWVRLLCAHNYTGGARFVLDSKGKKRYARICRKCGKRDYLD